MTKPMDREQILELALLGVRPDHVAKPDQREAPRGWRQQELRSRVGQKRVHAALDRVVGRLRAAPEVAEAGHEPGQRGEVVGLGGANRGHHAKYCQSPWPR